jgi:hypothetical protein
MGGYHIQASRSTVVRKAICSVVEIIKVFALDGSNNLSSFCALLSHLQSYLLIYLGPLGKCYFEDTQFYFWNFRVKLTNLVPFQVG